MGNIILTALLAASFGGAAVTVGQTYYSSSFQYDFCPGGAFKVTPSPGNVWHWEGDATAAGTNVVVDINGDGIMDTEHPEVRVCITDMQLVGTVGGEIVDSSGVRWTLQPQFTAGLPYQWNLATPIVLPLNSPLTVRGGAGSVPSRVRLIGRVVNI